MESWDPNTKSTLTQIPLLSTKAGLREGAAWTQRLKEEYKVLIAYTQMNKCNDNDWFRISAADSDGKTQTMYRGGQIFLTLHFKPLWAKNCPSFGDALYLGLAAEDIFATTLC